MSEDVSETLDLGKSRKSHQSMSTIMIMYINMYMLSIMLGAICMCVFCYER